MVCLAGTFALAQAGGFFRDFFNLHDASSFFLKELIKKDLAPRPGTVGKTRFSS